MSNDILSDYDATLVWDPICKQKLGYMYIIYLCDSTLQNGPVGSEVQNWLFAVTVLSAQFWCKSDWNQTLPSQDVVIYW